MLLVKLGLTHMKQNSFPIGDVDGSKRTRELLENFKAVGTRLHTVIVPGATDQKRLEENVFAAVLACTLRLSSIDYTKQRYCTSRDEKQQENSHSLYVQSYFSAKSYMQIMVKKLVTDGRPSPQLGGIGSDLVLERLPTSFFSAHLLYQLGSRYEGHAVSRLILEQIAWAYAACHMTDLDEIEAIETTKSISKLKQLAPWAGNLYGFLSQKTHIDYQNHKEFLTVEDGRDMVLLSHAEPLEYASVILQLADLFGIVWELSQAPYIDKFEAVEKNNNKFSPRKDRPFLAKLYRHLELIEDAVKQEK